MFKLNKFIETSKTVRHKGWHAEGNRAAKPVLMCDGKVVLLGDRDVNHYPLQDDDGICRHTTHLIYSENEF